MSKTSGSIFRTYVIQWRIHILLSWIEQGCFPLCFMSFGVSWSHSFDYPSSEFVLQCHIVFNIVLNCIHLNLLCSASPVSSYKPLKFLTHLKMFWITLKSLYLLVSTFGFGGFLTQKKLFGGWPIELTRWNFAYILSFFALVFISIVLCQYDGNATI